MSGSDHEDAYFQKRDQELRQQLRERLNKNAGELRDEDAARGSLSQRIAALGFEGERLKVFDLLPLVHVAWADGSIPAARAEPRFRRSRKRSSKGSSAPHWVKSMRWPAHSRASMRSSRSVRARRASASALLCTARATT